MIEKFNVKHDKLNDSFSYHGFGIKSSRKKLSELFGIPRNVSTRDDKVRFEWTFSCMNEFQEEYEITIYDWKMYRDVPEDEEIEWNIGSRGYRQSKEFAEFIQGKYDLETIDKHYEF